MRLPEAMRPCIALALAHADDAPGWLPASLWRLGPVTRSERHWDDLRTSLSPAAPRTTSA